MLYACMHERARKYLHPEQKFCGNWELNPICELHELENGSIEQTCLYDKSCVQSFCREDLRPIDAWKNEVTIALGAKGPVTG